MKSSRFLLLSGGQDAPLIDTIQQLGLSTGLKLALDAGDGASYPGTGQSWLDRSGNGYDFFLGADNAATATDPTFTGAVGARDAYFALDGGDYFTYDQASNEAWMENIHKDNAKFTLAMWAVVGSTGSVRIAGTANAAAGTGWVLGRNGGGALFLSVANANASVTQQSGPTIPAGMSFLAVSADESTGRFAFTVNATETVLTGVSYSSPSSGAASFNMKIGAEGASTSKLPAGSRFGSFMAWEGLALSSTQVASLFNATRARYGV